VQQVQFICLAHSKKYSKRCVAGVRLDTSEWIRPISKEIHGELTPTQVRLAEGGEPQNFDIISAWLGERAPVKNQPENWRIQNSPWRLICRPAPSEHAATLKKALFRGPVLFGNTADRVPFKEFETAPAKESLVLAKPAHPHWTVRRTLTWKKQLRVSFGLGPVTYDLAVTDIPYDDKLKELELGDYSSQQLGIPNDNAIYFTISLGEPFEGGHCYKLVAAVLQLPNGWPSLE
jgi:putative nucleic acid modification protein with dual OB domain